MSSHSSKAVLWINVGLMTAFIVVGTAFRTQLLLSNRSLWFDAAALAVNTVEAGYGELLPPLHYMSQTAPVGFMVATKAISRVFEYTEFSLLALPFAMGVLSLVLMGLLAWRLLPRTVMFLPVAFLSLSSTAIYYSAEYKSYSCDLFFSLLILRPRGCGRSIIYRLSRRLHAKSHASAWPSASSAGRPLRRLKMSIFRHLPDSNRQARYAVVQSR